MHEMSIAQSILDIVREEMARYQVTKLEAINVAVGLLSAIVPTSLTFCFKILVDGTDLEGVSLLVREVPLTYSCFQCQASFDSQEMVFKCPHCGAETPTMTAGRDMIIESIQVAD